MKEAASEIRWYERDLRDSGRLARVVVLLIKILVCTSMMYGLVAGATVWQAREGKTKHFVYPVSGLSMCDTIEELILRCGAFVVADRGLVPAQRDIVLFVDPRGGWDIKRISWLSQDGKQMRVLSDNYKRTGADSQTEPALAMLQTSSVCGVVTDVVTVQRLLRSMTARGRAENWLRFHYRERTQWDPTGQFVAVVESSVLIFALNNGAPKLLFDSQHVVPDSNFTFVTWRNGKASWSIGVAGDHVAFDLGSHRLERFRVTSARINERGWIDSCHLVVMGDVTKLLRPGDIYRGNRVKAVKYPYLGGKYIVPSGATQSEIVFE